MTLLISGILGASVISTVAWMLSGVLARPIIRSQPYLHLVTIYLTVAAFLLLNLFTFSAIFRWLNSTQVSVLYGFLTGVQTVAGISAALFVYRIARLRRHI